MDSHDVECDVHATLADIVRDFFVKTGPTVRATKSDEKDERARLSLNAKDSLFFSLLRAFARTSLR